MNKETVLLVCILVAAALAVAADRLYVGQLEKEFIQIERERIVTTNKLATAKIVYENLRHVRDLVFKNMDFPGQADSISQETRFFDFVTECINDLKLKLISVEPVRPVTNGRITTYGYNIEIEGDFFKVGELCAKFENSRRIVSVEAFNVTLISDEQQTRLGVYKGIRVSMRVNTYRVSKV